MSGFRHLRSTQRKGGYLSGVPKTDSAVWTLRQRYERIASPLFEYFPGAAAGYSLRQLAYDYTGPVVTVRRSSDSVEDDFTASEVADGTLAAFCGAGDGLVKTLYDQSGHGRDASQSTATAQPKIVSSGVLVLENGLPAIDFDGTDDYLSIDSVGISGQQSRSFFWCANEAGGITYGQGSNASGANWELVSGVLSRQLAISFQNINWSSSAYAQKVVSHFYTGGAITNASMYEDGASLASTSTNGTATINTSDSNANIGYEDRGGGFYLVGTLQELIIYPVDQSANRVAIEDNINSHYNVF